MYVNCKVWFILLYHKHFPPNKVSWPLIEQWYIMNIWNTQHFCVQNRFNSLQFFLVILPAKQTFEPNFPGEPIVQKSPRQMPFSIEFPRPDNPSRFTEQPYVSI